MKRFRSTVNNHRSETQPPRGRFQKLVLSCATVCYSTNIRQFLILYPICCDKQRHPTNELDTRTTWEVMLIKIVCTCLKWVIQLKRNVYKCCSDMIINLFLQENLIMIPFKKIWGRDYLKRRNDHNTNFSSNGWISYKKVVFPAAGTLLAKLVPTTYLWSHRWAQSSLPAFTCEMPHI